MKKIFITSLTILMFISLFILTGCEEKKVNITSEEDKTLYAIGVMFGSRLASLNLSDREVAAMIQGLKDSAKGKKPVIEVSKYHRKVQELFQKRMKESAEKVKKDGSAYMKKFLKETGVKKTKSGLAYKIIKEGKGKQPKATDKVRVHYHGTLTNGTVFDSSVDRKKDVTFPLNRVIKGWTEGLQLIKEGGKIRLVIPPELAYGDRGAGSKIPGGSTLIFDVELFEVNPPVKKPAKPIKPQQTLKAKVDKKVETKKK